MNGTGNFILGVIAAVVLFLLWKKNGVSSGGGVVGSAANGGISGGASCGAGCGACGTDSCAVASGGGPAYTASPIVQQAMVAMGLAGQITPGTPPLGGPDQSFYTAAGPTPDTTFTFGTQDSPVANVPGSATTPAAGTPARALQPVGTAYDLGFQNRYSYSGTFLRRTLPA